MNKKTSKTSSQKTIEIPVTRTPKKKNDNRPDPFSRLRLHPLEELEARDQETEISEAFTTYPIGSTDFTDTTDSIGTTEHTDTTDPVNTTDYLSTTDPLSSADNTSTTESTSTTDPTGTTDLFSSTGRTGTSRRSKIKSAATGIPVSPQRDFTKTPNSIMRIAVEQGLFRGKSKQIWDYLWMQSRGAVVPVRSVRRTIPQIIKGSGVGKSGVFAGIPHLEKVGLIRKEKIVGHGEGNVYEVFTPEEIGYFRGLSSVGSTGTTDTTGTTGKEVVPVLPENGTTDGGQPGLKADISEDHKTFLKDLFFIDDDTPIVQAFEKLNRAARAATGQDLTSKDWEAFSELIELIILETEVAGRRTTSISVYLKFGVENLKRRIYSKPKNVKRVERPSHLDVGRDSGLSETVDEFIPESKSPELLAQNLGLLKIQKEEGNWEFINSLQSIYTEEDWNWLMERLKD